MTKRTYIDDMNRQLTGTKYERYAHSVNMNIQATAFVLGITTRQVKTLMCGYKECRIGNNVLYAKEDVYAAWNERGVMTA